MKSEKEKSPLKVEIQFIEFEHNKKEKKAIYKLAKELGVWRLSIIQGSSIFGWKGNRFKGTEEERRKRGCYQLWTATKINSLGELCVCDFGEDHGLATIGPAKHYLFMKLRNHSTLNHMRKSFRNSSIALNALCKQCDKYRR